MISRRSFLFGAAGLAGASALAACSDSSSGGGTPKTGPTIGQVVPASTNQFTITGLPTLTPDQELDLPDEWITGAKSEGALAINSRLDSDQWPIAIAPFKARYPYINVTNVTGTDETVVKTLAEYKLGKVSYDIVLGSANQTADYKAANALVPLTFAPAYKEFPAALKDSNDMAIGQNMRFWGMGYNTNLVSPDDAPKDWEDLTDPKFKGKIAIVNRPSQFMLALWVDWGPEKATDYLNRFFANEPERRTEDIGAMSELLAAGEFPIAIPMGINQMQAVQAKGGPVAWNSPEPIEARPGCVFMLNGSKNPNAAKIYVSWLLSQEGQASNATAEVTVPTLPSLMQQGKYYGSFGPTLNAKQWHVVSAQEEAANLPALTEVWSKLWKS